MWVPHGGGTCANESSVCLGYCLPLWTWGSILTLQFVLQVVAGSTGKACIFHYWQASFSPWTKVLCYYFRRIVLSRVDILYWSCSTPVCRKFLPRSASQDALLSKLSLRWVLTSLYSVFLGSSLGLWCCTFDCELHELPFLGKPRSQSWQGCLLWHRPRALEAQMETCLRRYLTFHQIVRLLWRWQEMGFCWLTLSSYRRMNLWCLMSKSVDYHKLKASMAPLEAFWNRLVGLDRSLVEVSTSGYLRWSPKI